MKCVVQRVRGASVTVGGAEVARIGAGLLALLGVAAGDGAADVVWMARKVAELRIFGDEAGKMNRSLADSRGELLVVSQFTLLGDCRKGRRPSFTGAAPPAEGERLYEEFLAEAARVAKVPVRCGRFGADMLVALENDGPVTLILDSRDSNPSARRGDEATSGDETVKSEELHSPGFKRGTSRNT